MNYLNMLEKLDTTEISDALDAIGIEGALLGIKSLIPSIKFIGPAFTVKYLPYDNKTSEFKSAGNYIDDVPPHAVIVIDNNGQEDCTCWGNILTQVAIMRDIAGTVIYGAARDIKFIKENKYPVFAKAMYMRSGKNRVYKVDQQCALTINSVSINPGDIVIGDDNGVVVVPKEKFLQVIENAKNIKKTEELIVSAFKSGMSLEEARKKHRYDQPWLLESEKIKL